MSKIEYRVISASGESFENVMSKFNEAMAPREVDGETIRFLPYAGLEVHQFVQSPEPYWVVYQQVVVTRSREEE